MLAAVNVYSGKPSTDFGRGFYTTTSLSQARSWAAVKSVRKPGSHPAVVEFQIDRDVLAALENLWFVVHRSSDFWNFVDQCRAGGDHSRAVNGGWYDVVAGPVTRSFRDRSVHAPYDQVSFHTPAAEALLNASPRSVLSTR